MDHKRFAHMARTLSAAPTPVSPRDSRTPWQPMARRDHLVTSQIGDEVLVYDETTHAIHRLNPTSHAIWSLCDGTRTGPVIAQAAAVALGSEVPLEVVDLALGQLGEAHLLAGPLPMAERAPLQSRRVLLRRMAIAGGIALPVLVSVSAPTAAVAGFSCQAQGGLGTGASCTESSQCCTGYCNGSVCATVPTQPTPTPPSQITCGVLCSVAGGCVGACPVCRQVPIDAQGNTEGRCFS